MKVSVYLPTYNRFESVNYAIESFLSQDYENKELVVYNNDTTGKMSKILKWYDDRIKIVESNNNSQLLNINNWWNNSDADLLCQLHDDDSFTENSISSRVECFKRNKELEVLYAGVNDIENGVITKRPALPLDIKRLVEHDYINVTSMMWRNNIKSKLMFNEDFYYQSDLVFKLQCAFDCNMQPFIHNFVMNYNIHPKQFTTIGKPLMEYENKMLMNFLKKKYNYES